MQTRLKNEQTDKVSFDEADFISRKVRLLMVRIRLDFLVDFQLQFQTFGCTDP